MKENIRKIEHTRIFRTFIFKLTSAIINGDFIMETINREHFDKIEIRVGTILEAEKFHKARKPALKLKIDFGEFGIKKSSAQISDLYSPGELIGKQVIGVINFPVKQIGNFFSECLVTGFCNHKNEVVLAVPDKYIENGSKLM